MSNADTVTADFGSSGRALADCVRKAKALFERGKIEQVHRLFEDLPPKIAHPAQELVFGKPAEVGSLENDGAMWLASPKERAVAKWRKSINAFLGLA